MSHILSIEEFPDEIPSARYFRVYSCPSCHNAHIVLFTEDDVPFAQFTVAQLNLQRIIVDCNVVFGKTFEEREGALIIPFPPPK